MIGRRAPHNGRSASTPETRTDSVVPSALTARAATAGSTRGVIGNEAARPARTVGGLLETVGGSAQRRRSLERRPRGRLGPWVACSRCVRLRLGCRHIQDVTGGAGAHAGGAELTGQLRERLALARERRWRVEQPQRLAPQAAP